MPRSKRSKNTKAGFQIQSEYKPMGDQPKAIKSLIKSIEKGEQYQTLLGATGTGKSLGYDDPVFVVRQQGNEKVPAIAPIGELIDDLISQHSDQIHQQNDTQVLDAGTPQDEYYAQSFNPETGRVDLYKIRSFIRHDAPKQMYRLQTACGRSATLTGDHNLWVLRDGQLQLIKTTEALTTDYVPLPETLLNEGNLQSLDLAQQLADQNCYVDASAALLHYIDEHGTQELNEAATLAALSANAWRGKIFAMRHQAKNRGIASQTFEQILHLIPELSSHLEQYPARLGLGSYEHYRPAQESLSPALLRLLGLYIAEGHGQKRYITISNQNPVIRHQLEADLKHLDIPFSIRSNSDYQISSKTLTKLFVNLCGNNSRNKRLPDFWPQLSPTSLGKLLQAYFDGDGTVDHWSAVTAITASHPLASDLTYALLSLGIWARISKKWKKATRTHHKGNWYYQISISGQENLQKFEQWIGFSIDYKQQSLKQQCQHKAHSNVDVVAIDGQQLRQLRRELNISAKSLAEMGGISRSGLQFFERGQRRPRRVVLKQVLTALRTVAQAQGYVSPQWWQSWKAIEQLTHLRWSAIAQLQEIDYPHPYVYDFCVPGAETFLGGQGGFFVHNTFTMANVIEKVGKPTLVLAHNKTLAAQLCNELRSFFPNNAVEYFISYYDYYQPEAYIPVSDTYIAKTASINEEIDMLRHSATRSLFERKDVIVVASISCIYGLGIPSEYLKASIPFRVGEEVNLRGILRDLVTVQYTRNDLDVGRGRFRVKGDVLEIGPAYEDRIIRVEFFGDEIDAIRYIDPVTGEIMQSMDSVNVYPARHFVTPEERLQEACDNIKAEFEAQLEFLQKENKLLEAQRLEQRTKYDLEMLREVGYCQGVENYSRHLAGRNAGDPPECLVDYFPLEDWMLMIDESHVTVPQIRAMYNGDQARKKVLIDHGFRLPSAADNRPLKADEFWAKVKNCVFVSATPGQWELKQSEAAFEDEAEKVYLRGTGRVVEQVIRPTGVIDPEVMVRPTDGQVDDLLGEINERAQKKERTLVTTLTKKMAEDLTEYLYDRGVKVRYMHSEINSIERIEIIRDLREGIFDVLIGVNLLREGLDLPEVSLVAILDADKEGFLRAERSLIQTIGRAARHIEGKAILYADNMTDSMVKAISETERRRKIQTAYNKKHNITPQPITKKVDDSILAFLEVSRRLNAQELEVAYQQSDDIPLADLPELIQQLEDEMKKAAKELEFERAGELRDRIKTLRQKLVGQR